MSNYCDDCKSNNILKRASFGFPNDNKKIRCGMHKLLGMIDLINTKCTECNSIASFGFQFPNHKKLRCKTHQLFGMVNLITKKKCTECNAIAIFGFSDGKKLRCRKHQLQNMINLDTNSCTECNATASFGFPDCKKLRCKKHQLSGMINLRTKKCTECNAVAIFGSSDDDEKLRCRKHQLPNMINLDTNSCTECDKTAIYRIPGESKSKCSTHKEAGMIKFSNTRCQAVGCEELALYGTNYKPIHCEQHIKENEHSLVEENCKSCGLVKMIKQESLCSRCISCKPKYKKQRLDLNV